LIRQNAVKLKNAGTQNWGYLPTHQLLTASYAMSIKAIHGWQPQGKYFVSLTPPDVRGDLPNMSFGVCTNSDLDLGLTERVQ